LWESARTAKETLSRLPVSIVALPGSGAEVTLDRATFDRLAAPLVGRTVRAARAAVTAAGLSVRDVDAVLLVGGASRMPLVSELLTEEFGRPPVAVDQPELVVAQGSLAAPPSTVEPAPSTVDEMPTLSPSTMEPRPARRRRAAWTAGAAAALLLLAATVGLAVRTGGERRPVDTTWVAPGAVPISGSTSSAPKEMSPALKAFAGAWARDLPCGPIGFEGPFDLPAGIRQEMIERFRCDITSGPGQGVTVYFVYFGAVSALEATRRYYGALRTGHGEFTRAGNRVMLWYDTWRERCMGWVQAPSASFSDRQLSTIWRYYQDETRAMSASASPR
jgi:hypothetical protein